MNPSFGRRLLKKDLGWPGPESFHIYIITGLLLGDLGFCIPPGNMVARSQWPGPSMTASSMWQVGLVFKLRILAIELLCSDYDYVVIVIRTRILGRVEGRRM